MDLSITPKITLLAEVDGEKGKNSDGDITPAKFVSTRPENGKTTQIPWLCCRVHWTCLLPEEDTEENKWSTGT